MFAYRAPCGWVLMNSANYRVQWLHHILGSFESLIDRNTDGTCSSDGGAALGIEEVQPLEVYADPGGCALSYRGPAIQAGRERP